MARTQKFTCEQVVEACAGSGGNRAVIAKRLQCDRSTVCWYEKRYASVREAIQQADEEVTDLAESKAVQLINAEYWPAIRYRLSTKGKNRGYAERTEITGKDGEPVAFTLADLVKAVTEQSANEEGDTGGQSPTE